MASSAKTSSTATNVDRNSGPAWDSLSNALTNDSSYAGIELTLANDTSDWAVFTNWGFNISPLASINGIVFSYVGSTAVWANEIATDEIHLYDNSLTNTWPSYQSNTNWSTTSATFTVGSPSDLWGYGVLEAPGITVDADTINGSNFGVAISVKAGDVYGASTFTGQLYYVSMTIYHTINGIRYGSTEIKDVRIGNTQVTRGYLGGTSLNTDEITIL